MERILWTAVSHYMKVSHLQDASSVKSECIFYDFFFFLGEIGRPSALKDDVTTFPVVQILLRENTDSP